MIYRSTYRGGYAGGSHHLSYLWHSSRVNSVRLKQIKAAPEDGGPLERYLLDYAANYWAFHTRECQEAILKLALQLLTNQELSANAFRHAKSLYKPWSFLWLTEDGGDGESTKLTGLHLVAAMGLNHLCRELTKIIYKTQGIHIRPRDENRRTPITRAAHHGYEEVVRYFIPKRYIIHEKCGRSDTPLHYAARHGWASIVELFLKMAGEPEGEVYWREDLATKQNNFGETALIQAALGGHSSVVKLLLPYDPNSINCEVMFGLWPIHLAAQMRPASTVRAYDRGMRGGRQQRRPKGPHAIYGRRRLGEHGCRQVLP